MSAKSSVTIIVIVRVPHGTSRNPTRLGVPRAPNQRYGGTGGGGGVGVGARQRGSGHWEGICAAFRAVALAMRKGIRALGGETGGGKRKVIGGHPWTAKICGGHG